MSRSPREGRPNLSHITKLVFIVTETCNLRCGYCYASTWTDMRPARAMSPDTARTLVRGLFSAAGHCELIQFFGGEPTLNLPAIEAAIDETLLLVANGTLLTRPRFAIVTNGVFQDPLRVHDLLARHRIEVTVSLDGPAPIHNALRPLRGHGATYDRAIETIGRVRGQGLPTAIESVYTTEHLARDFSVVDLLQFVQELDVDRLILTTTYPPAPAHLDPLREPHRERVLSYWEDAVDWWFESLITLTRRVVRIYFADLLLPLLRGVPATDPRDGCSAATSDFAVGPTGDLFACLMFYPRSDYRLGNVLTGEYPGIAQSFPSGIEDLSACRGCSARYWCQPCAALNLSSGDLWHPPEADCALRRTVVCRIAQWAFARLSVPENAFTSILRPAV